MKKDIQKEKNSLNLIEALVKEGVGGGSSFITPEKHIITYLKVNFLLFQNVQFICILVKKGM